MGIKMALAVFFWSVSDLGSILRATACSEHCYNSGGMIAATTMGRYVDE